MKQAGKCISYDCRRTIAARRIVGMLTCNTAEVYTHYIQMGHNVLEGNRSAMAEHMSGIVVELHRNSRMIMFTQCIQGVIMFLKERC